MCLGRGVLSPFQPEVTKSTLSLPDHISRLLSKIKSKIVFLYRMRSTFTNSCADDPPSYIKTMVMVFIVRHHSAIQCATNAPLLKDPVIPVITWFNRT